MIQLLIMKERPAYLDEHVRIADFALRGQGEYPTHEDNARDLVRGWDSGSPDFRYPQTKEFIHAWAKLLELRAEGAEIIIIPDDKEDLSEPICQACGKCQKKE